MACLDSTSSLREVLAAYDDNASYAEDNSIDKARAFVTACRILLSPGRTPQQQDHDQESLRFRHESIQKELDRALDWIERNGSTSTPGQVLYYDSQHLRF